MDQFTDASYYYKAHQEEITSGHLGEYVVIQGKTVLGYFENYMDGFKAMAKKNVEPGTYIVHKCEAPDAPKLSAADLGFVGTFSWAHSL
jgi:hypothetical protein